MKTLACCLCTQESSSSSSLSSSSSPSSSSSYHPGCVEVCDPMPARWKVTIPFDETAGNACQSLVEGPQTVHAHTVWSDYGCRFSSRKRLTIPRCNADYSSCVLTDDHEPEIGNIVSLYIQRIGADRVYFVTAYVVDTDGFSAGIHDHFGPVSIIVPHSDDCMNTVSKAISAGPYGCGFYGKAGDLVVEPAS